MIKLFFYQVLSYSICCFSFRVLAQGNAPLSVATDVVYALVQFTIMRQVANGGDSWPRRIAYALGSATGTYIAIVLSKAVTGK